MSLDKNQKMPNCAVLSCRNYTKKVGRDNGNISFHRFPSDPKVKEKWIEATGQKNWFPTQYSRICSVHFNEGSFTDTKKFRLRLTTNAIPTIDVLKALSPGDIDQNLTTHEPPPSSTPKRKLEKMCRICFATDRKMYCLDTVLYEEITGLTFTSKDLLPKYVCWECNYHMVKYTAFRSKAVASHCVLTEMLDSGGFITSINNLKVKSTLICTDILCIKEERTLVHRYGNESDIKSECRNNNLNFNNDFIHLTNDENLDANSFIVLSEDIKKIENDDRPISATNFYNETEENSENIPENNDHVFESTLYTKGDKKAEYYEAVEDEDSTHSSEENKKVEKTKIQICSKRKRKKGDCAIIKDSKKANKKIKKVAKVSLKKLQKPRSKEKNKNNVTLQIDQIDKSIFTLKKLSAEEQYAEIEKRKDNENYKRSMYRCTSCFRVFLDAEKLNRHMEKHSDSNGAFECKLCKLRYMARYKLNLHMKTHLYKISCQLCSFNTYTLSVAIKHQNHHKGKQFVCPHCKEIYTHGSTYLSHLRIKHPSNATCQVCGHSFINERGLLIHKKSVHRFDHTSAPVSGPVCARCDIRFSCQDALDTHRRVSAHHADERNSAEEKDQRKKDPKCRSKPTSQPFPDGPRPCEQCEERLPNARAYFRHFRKEHKGINRTVFYTKKALKYMCEICGKLFQNATILRDHQYIHSDTKQFKCDRCGKLFQLKAHMKLHQRHHCGSRVPYPCPVCGKVFSNQCNMQRHMVSHTGVRAFKCEMCDKTFAHLGNKKVHIEFVHKKKPWPKRDRTRKRNEPQAETMHHDLCEDPHLQEWNTT